MCILTILPDGEGLETVDHGSIVAVGSRGQNDEAQADVGPTKTSILVPGPLWELAPSKAESALGWCLHCGSSREYAAIGGWDCTKD